MAPFRKETRLKMPAPNQMYFLWESLANHDQTSHLKMFWTIFTQTFLHCALGWHQESIWNLNKLNNQKNKNYINLVIFVVNNMEKLHAARICMLSSSFCSPHTPLAASAGHSYPHKPFHVSNFFSCSQCLNRLYSTKNWLTVITWLKK